MNQSMDEILRKDNANRSFNNVSDQVNNSQVSQRVLETSQEVSEGPDDNSNRRRKKKRLRRMESADTHLAK